MKANGMMLSRLSTKEWVISAKVTDEAVEQAKLLYDTFHDSEINIEIGKYSNSRSLSANAYFHVLCRKIGMAMNPVFDEERVKKLMVETYGEYARDDDGKLMGVAVPSNTQIEKFYPYVKCIGEQEVNGKTQKQYLFFKHTSDMTVEEMKRLIDGTVQEAKDLGVETMTPRELEALNYGR